MPTAEIAVSQTDNGKTSKPFRAPPITRELASRLGELVGSGLLFSHALAALPEPITAEAWKRATADPKHGGSLLRAYQLKVAEGIQNMLAQITPETKGWQALAWKLERALGYTTQKGPSVVVNVNTINGVDNSVLARAKTFVTAKPAKVKQVTNGES